MDPYVLEVGNWVIKVVVNDVCGNVSGPFVGVVDEVVEVNIDVP